MINFIILQRQQSIVLENKLAKDELRYLKQEISQTNEGLLLLERVSLENTLKSLSEEVFNVNINILIIQGGLLKFS